MNDYTHKAKYSFPATSFEELEAARAALARLQDEHAKAFRRREELLAARDQAIADDRDRLATALIDGKKAPSADAIAKLDEQIAQVERRLDALIIGLNRLERDALAVVERHRGEWITATDEQIEADRRAYRDTVEAMGDAHDRLARSLGLRGWLDDFPSAKAGLGGRKTMVAGLKRPSGDMFPFEAVRAALLEDAAPEPAPTRAERAPEGVPA
jgi:hypothetical protein